MKFVPFFSMTSLVSSMGPYLCVTTWIVNKGVVKLFKPFFQLLKQMCPLPPLPPFAFDLGMGIKFKPLWHFSF
jgi:hypothetical protein